MAEAALSFPGIGLPLEILSRGSRLYKNYIGTEIGTEK